MRTIFLKACICALLVVTTTMVVRGAEPAKADWTGIWKRVGSFGFDPSIPPEHREFPPYRPEWQARYEEALAAHARGEATADPTANCLPGGMPRIMNMVYPMEIIQKPRQLTIISEWGSQVRRIFLDGRQHPSELDPTFNGHSIGHWSGDVLIVDTVGLRDDTVLDQSGIRHSDQMRIIEKFKLVDANTLQNEITVEDPVAFYKPWTVVKTYRRAPELQMMEYVCEENNRNPLDASGKTTTILAPQPK